MPLFSYKARDKDGKIRKGELFAETEKSLFLSLKESGLYLVSCSRVKEKKSSSIWKKGVFEKVNRRDLIDFSSNLATILSSGIPILSGLQELEAMSKKAVVRDCIARIAEDIRSGSMLSEGMERQPEVFSEAYINAIRAGELSGNMDEVLREMVSFLEWQQEMAENTKKVLTYPAVVLSAISILLFIIIGFILPRIIPVFTSLNVDVPLATRVLLSIGLFIRGNWIFILLFLAVLAVVSIYYGKGKRRPIFIDRLLLKVPVVGGLIEKFSVSRFVHNLKIMHQAGVDIRRSLEVAEKGVGNRVIGEVIKRTREEVTRGGSLSASLLKSGHIPPLVSRMFSVGETTGKMDECLENITKYYDRDIPETVEKVMGRLQPLMIIILGIAVLFIAGSFFIPLYKMMAGIR
jgi:type IV pilus assembly protein PilC